TLRGSEPHEFRDWQPTEVTEMLGDGDVRVYQMSDEQLLVNQVHSDPRRLAVMRAPEDATGTTWVWKSPNVWIGMTATLGDDFVYVRHRVAEEVQYQVSGSRTLRSQNGTVKLESGDFVKIPRGCAFSSEGQSRYISLLSLAPLRRVPEVSRRAEMAERATTPVPARL
ncbi:MAG: hypothetical protein JOZ65_12980, partial [Chloroflexi bacterium]|nr:hypothetical protein [Chloroflexota bacterium]